MLLTLSGCSLPAPPLFDRLPLGHTSTKGIFLASNLSYIFLQLSLLPPGWDGEEKDASVLKGASGDDQGERGNFAIPSPSA
jgi:hypothetical protein